MSRIYLPPDGGLLNSYANARLTWATALGEEIDNAFDAEAQTVSIEFTKSSLIIKDDGIGCADPTAMIRLGAHAKHASTRLGRYGIGGKDAALWIGGLDSTIVIRTEHQGRLRKLDVNWRDFSRDWGIEPLIEMPGTTDEYRTEIRITPAKRPPYGESWRELLATLGYLYSAALKKGRQIKFKRPGTSAAWEPLVRWELPQFDGAPVDTRIVVKGRGARVYCGVVRAGELNSRCGLTYSHEWRVIEQASAKGCGNGKYSIARVCGFVDLDDSWPLTKNKDGVSRDAEELYAAVEVAVQPILERAHEISTELRSRQFDVALNDTLNHVMAQRAKARRQRGTVTGTTTPTGSGRKHTRAKQEQPGNTFPASQQIGQFRLEFRPFGQADDLGEVKPPYQVLLNLDNAAVADLRARDDVTGLVLLAVCLIGAAHCASDKPLLQGLPVQGFGTKEFSRAVGHILSAPMVIDGKVALRVVS